MRFHFINLEFQITSRAKRAKRVRERRSRDARDFLASRRARDRRSRGAPRPNHTSPAARDRPERLAMDPRNHCLSDSTGRARPYLLRRARPSFPEMMSAEVAVGGERARPTEGRSIHDLPSCVRLRPTYSARRVPRAECSHSTNLLHLAQKGGGCRRTRPPARGPRAVVAQKSCRPRRRAAWSAWSPSCTTTAQSSASSA